MYLLSDGKIKTKADICLLMTLIGVDLSLPKWIYPYLAQVFFHLCLPRSKIWGLANTTTVAPLR